MYTIVADLHLYSSIEIKIPRPFAKLPKTEIILLGDIVDLKNCRESDLKAAKALMDELINNYGASYVSGNHELGYRNIFAKRGEVLFTHGDYIFWPVSKAIAARDNYPCSGYIKRAGSAFLNSLSDIFDRDISEKDMDAAIPQMKRRGCTVLVTGHKHFRQTKRKFRDGYTLISVPRGITHIGF